MSNVKCPACGAPMENNVCTYCGYKEVTTAQRTTNISSQNHSYVNHQTVNTVMKNKSSKSKMFALLLCVFFGMFGIHRFYVGKIGTGILWLFTGGVVGIGWIVDIFMILFGTFKDKNGYPLK